MKIIVTHSSPDWDAITSVWLIKRFLPGWEDAEIRFVPAGQRFRNISFMNEDSTDPIEHVESDEMIHVDTGLGPLDHHQTSDMQVCAASRTWDYVQQFSIFNFQFSKNNENDRLQVKKEAVDRMVKVIVAVDHFQEVFWENPTADYHELSFLGLLDGIKYQKPDQDQFYIRFGMDYLDAILHNFENRIWAEKEIQEKGKAFKTRFGMGLGFESLNDTVIKLSQKMGYAIVIRKDPRKGYVRIKVRPERAAPSALPLSLEGRGRKGGDDIDLTPVYEKLKEMDPQATWFLHVSKKMLLNGTTKNPKMIPTKLTLDEIIKVVEEI